MKGLVLWITGLPGSGKSAVADRIQQDFPRFVILRMDEMRKVVTPAPTYSDAERDIVYRSLVYTARILSDLGHHVIIDATGNRRQWRDFARASVSRFAEIYLRCPLDVCMAREVSRKDRHGAPPDIYRKGMDGAPVPGLQVPYEEPLSAELVIETDRVSIDDAGALIKRFLSEQLADERESPASNSI